jgi:hydroxymethylglutaryl-CoA lyase
MVRVIEVGPRDGLQNEAKLIPTAAKVRFVERLAAAGLKEIEAASFVSPKWTPQMADASDVWASLPDGPDFSALVPNEKGLERALAVGVSRIALFTSATDEFSQKNTNMSQSESLAVLARTAAAFRHSCPDGWIRGYLSVAFECPYSGRVSPGVSGDLAFRLLEMGCDEVSIGDTIGAASPSEVKALAREISAIPRSQVAWHFHDTRGTGLANVCAALDLGYRAFDASAGGLGGCPYAPGAGGNLATEDLAYLLEREGLETGIDLDRLAKASLEILDLMERPPEARAQRASLGACK